jgi:hypothetical protein
VVAGVAVVAAGRTGVAVGSTTAGCEPEAAVGCAGGVAAVRSVETIWAVTDVGACADPLLVEDFTNTGTAGEAHAAGSAELRSPSRPAGWLEDAVSLARAAAATGAGAPSRLVPVATGPDAGETGCGAAVEWANGSESAAVVGVVTAAAAGAVAGPSAGRTGGITSAGTTGEAGAAGVVPADGADGTAVWIVAGAAGAAAGRLSTGCA